MTRRAVDPALAALDAEVEVPAGTSADVLRERARALRAEAEAAERMADAADAAVAEGALEQFQGDALARLAAAHNLAVPYAPESAIAEARAAVEARRNRTGPHDDQCPNCGAQAYDNPDDPQMCGECGTRVCPVCGADFAETYAMPEQDRLTDNLGEHVRRWHEGVTL